MKQSWCVNTTNGEKRIRLKQFYNDWNQTPDRKLFAKVFEKCEEITEFILENAEDGFEEVIEEE
ncbi:hypothetical protein HNQ80_002174 [Anaerosolibacter carboniphilus]|uniref:Uncharacterized protein n=1 Tax=Anaerosolibacter carboniphilus TaxID=1417629 RepID=A0A841L126_9FIRM|nr:hypothetical protein [Anaerosolibacter carboniphilus]MBB6216075.1 hypothetical protein [Anaerosolibacter carboniphilus]